MAARSSIRLFTGQVVPEANRGKGNRDFSLLNGPAIVVGGGIGELAAARALLLGGSRDAQVRR